VDHQRRLTKECYARVQCGGKRKFFSLGTRFSRRKNGVGYYSVALTIQLPAHANQTEFNLRRWTELVNDPELTKLPFGVETDRFGRTIMSPPPAPDHTKRSARILRLLHELAPHGLALPEIAISTSDGVKVADAAWLHSERAGELDSGPCLVRAPDVCIEVLSPSNSDSEMAEKSALYFEAGATEVWICLGDGTMEFYSSDGSHATSRSKVCPVFPQRV
jgi:Uma2 family endonuclease